MRHLNPIFETLQKDNNDTYHLYRNGVAAQCPYRAPIAIPGQLAGQISLIASQCNSTCPLFRINKLYSAEGEEAPTWADITLDCCTLTGLNRQVRLEDADKGTTSTLKLT